MGKRRDVKRKRMSVIGIVYVITPAREGNDSIELCGEARGYEATAKGRDRDNGNVSGAEVLGRSVYESAIRQEGKRARGHSLIRRLCFTLSSALLMSTNTMPV